MDLGGRISIAVTEKKHYEIMAHELVPEHIVLSEKETKELLTEFGITQDQLPKLLHNDPAAIACGAKPGDILKIIRKSHTAKEAIVYRLVIESETS